MERDILSMQIASGILIAAVIMAIFRLAVWRWQEGDYAIAVPLFIISVFFGGGFILAGMRIIAW